MKSSIHNMRVDTVFHRLTNIMQAIDDIDEIAHRIRETHGSKSEPSNKNHELCTLYKSVFI